MKKTEIHAVEMVRAIRDKMYQETKDLSEKDFLAYISRQAEVMTAKAWAMTTKTRKKAA